MSKGITMGFRAERAGLLAVLAAALACLTGCATVGQDKLFDTSSPTHTAAIPGTSQTASVYILRKKPSIPMLVPLVPFAYGVDERVVSVMPVGTYVHMQLPAGWHTFSQIKVDDMIVTVNVSRVDLSLNLEANKTYFLGWQYGFNLEAFPQEQGTAMLSNSVPARFIYAPITIANFSERAKRSNAADQRRSTSSIAARFESALPSQDQVSRFFENVAAVALVALVIAGAAAGHSGGPSTISPLLTSPPAIIQPQFESASGRRAQVVQEGSTRRLYSPDTGVTYTESNDKITGSDGSRYTVSGNAIYSTTGDYYQRIGNQIRGNDGTSCDVIGTSLYCKKR